MGYPHWFRAIPYILIYSRLAMGGLLLILSSIHFTSYSVVAIILLITAVVTDIFDGIIARQLNVSTQRMRRMDSAVDQVFWILTLVSTFIYCKNFFIENLTEIALLLGLEFLTYLVCYLKFRKEVATHAIASKIWTLSMLALIVQVTIDCSSTVLFQVCFYLGVASRLEIVAILLLLKEWTSDVPTFYHAILLRKGKPIKRHKLFNG
jgi:phosphatidylglycerophosphate synthase